MRLAQRFALENDKIIADCIESTEFPELASRYRVFAVPRTVINDRSALEGALPEEFFLEGVLKALEPEGGSKEPAKNS